MFHILIWGLGALVGGAKPTKAPPWRRGCTAQTIGKNLIYVKHHLTSLYEIKLMPF